MCMDFFLGYAFYYYYKFARNLIQSTPVALVFFLLWLFI